VATTSWSASPGPLAASARKLTPSDWAARRNGWILAPLAAQIVTAYALGTDPGPLAARFDPARFG
jgi:hypothetical protein